MKEMTIGIVGCGSIGRKVAADLDRGAVPGAQLTAVSDLEIEEARSFAESLSRPPRVLRLEDLARKVDLVIEAAGGAALSEIAGAALDAGKDLLALSSGALLDRDDLFELARRRGATIHVPSGAIAGLDGVAAAAVGRIDSVTMVTRKPPEGLRGAAGVIQAGVDVDEIEAPVKVFEGPAREACRLFPANANVSAALSMAGIGPDRTAVQIYADPTVTRNTHEIRLDGEFGSLSVKVESVPSPSNPRTSALSALSVIATLRKMTSDARVGT
jgi:aspartate dehydrogenase